MDLIYESVGSGMFETCVDALAPRGTLIVIGMMSAHADGGADMKHLRRSCFARVQLWRASSS